jgi:hypothetical protein
VAGQTDPQILSFAEARDVAKMIVDAAVQCHSPGTGQHIIAFGTVNTFFDTNDNNFKSNDDYPFKVNGKSFGQIVNDAVAEENSLGATGSTVAVAGGIDAENFDTGQYKDPPLDTLTGQDRSEDMYFTKAWESGYLAQTRQALYDYGSNGGCEVDGGNNEQCMDAAGDGGLNSSTSVYLAPESYDSQTPQPTNDVDNAFAHMRDIGTHGHQLYISTIVTQFEACTANGPGACGPLDASPALGFARQYASGDLNKKQGGIPYLTDFISSHTSIHKTGKTSSGQPIDAPVVTNP